MQSPISLAEIKLTLLASGIKYTDLDTCIEWAFNSIETPIRDWVKVWNSKHIDIFEMTGKYKLFDVIYLIGQSYVQEHYDPCDAEEIHRLEMRKRNIGKDG